MRQLLSTFAILTVTIVLLVACNEKAATGSVEATTFDLAGARKAIDSTNSVFSGLVAKGDSVGLAALYTSDGKIMVSNMPTASGRNAIQSMFSGMLSSMGAVEINLTTLDAWGNEDLVSEEGTYVINKDGKEMDRGKYIVLWKMEDGKWKLFRDIFNSDLAPQEIDGNK